MFRFNQLAILLNTAVLCSAILCSSALTTSCRTRSTSQVRTLPNEGFASPEASGQFYNNLIAFFEGANLDLSPQQTPLNLSWPLTTEKILLTRFGTPTIVNLSPPADDVKLAVFHEAVDIVRSSETSDDEVHAPMAGRATVIFDGSPDGHDADTYGTAVAIYDPMSHYVISLLHVSPSDQIKPGQLTDVRLGSVIGHLAPVQSMKPEFENKFRHTHVSQINVRDKTLVNPLTNFREYKDTMRPTVKEIYITDEAGAKHSDLISGNLDIVADAFDRDDQSMRNFEVTFFSYKIVDDKGNTIKTVQSCNLNFLTE
ncbi:MAG: hypothetical protein WCO71_08715, partial [Pseudomonadota bacterium]